MKTRAAILAATLLFAGWTLRALAVAEPADVGHPLAGLPMTVGAWSGQPSPPIDPADLAVLRVDDYVLRTYSSRRGAVELYVGYYATQRQGGTMHSPLNCLPGAGWESVSREREQVAIPGGTAIELNRYVVQKGLDKRLILYWYQSHGRSVASEYASRAYLVLDSLRMHRSDGALVRVTTGPIQEESRADALAASFVQAMTPALLHTVPR